MTERSSSRRALLVIATAAALACVVGAGLWWSGARVAADAPETRAQAPTEATPSRGITGTVVDSTGAPIADATVFTGAGAQAKTRSDGRFALSELPPGTHLLDARAEGYVSPGPQSMRRVEVTLTDGEPIAGLRLALQRPARLSGHILASGAAVPGARIGAYYLFADGLDARLEPFAVEALARSGADGRFEITSLTPGRLRLLVEAEGHAFVESQELYLEPGELREGVEIDLAPRALLTGAVRDEQGAPVAAQLRLRGGPLARSRVVDTRADGTYVFRDIPPGLYRLEASAPGYRSEARDSVRVVADKPSREDLELRPASGIFGQVLRPSGEPAASSFVWLSADQGRPHLLRADEQGRFEWENPAASGYVAQALAREHASSPEVAVVRGEELVLQLRPGGAVLGRVIGPAGRPVQSFSVGVEAIEVDGPRPYRPASLGSEKINNSRGAFEFASLRPGAYWFRVQTTRYAPQVSQRVVVRGGTSVTDVVIRLDQGGEITGTVTDEETGEPVAGARVMVFNPSSPFAANQTRTGADGRYTLAGVAPGRRSVRVTKNGYLSTVEAGVAVTPAAPARRDVQIRRQKPGERMQFHGIGAVLRKTDDGVQVMRVMDGLPASQFGLADGDYIRAVDREPVEGLRLESVIEQIRGESGVPVELEIEREGQGRMTVEIERGRVVVKGRTGIGRPRPPRTR